MSKSDLFCQQHIVHNLSIYLGLPHPVDDPPGDEIDLSVEDEDDGEREVESHHGGVQLIDRILRN